MGDKTVLVADDEERIRELVTDFLKNSGYNVITADNGEKALEMIRSGNVPDLAVIDIMMPEMDGWELTKEIRKSYTFPIIMLSARSEEFDMLESFERGVDEYVTKPFSPAVLVKRVDALIKRNVIQPKNKEGLEIDSKSYTASLDGKELELTLKEFELLNMLNLNANRILTREQLLNSIWGYDYLGDSRTVDSHIARLRTKLGIYGSTHLKTVYGMGYKLEK